MTAHPIQPLERDTHGVRRFKKNRIVEYLLDNGGIDMNTIAGMNFTREDRVQFAQLIGYSVDGFSTLSYVDDCDYALCLEEATQEHNETFRSGFDEGRRSVLTKLQELIEEVASCD